MLDRVRTALAGAALLALVAPAALPQNSRQDIQQPKEIREPLTGARAGNPAFPSFTPDGLPEEAGA